MPRSCLPLDMETRCHVPSEVQAHWGGSSSARTRNDYVSSYRDIRKTLKAGTVTQYNIDEYSIGEYTNGLALEEVKSNLAGSGSIIQLGFEADINQNPLSIQKIDVYVKAGKTI